MKISVNTMRILNAVATASSYVAKDGEHAGKLTISGINGHLEVKVTNYVQTVVLRKIPFSSSDMTLDSIEAFSIDGKKLLTALKAVKTENIELERSSDILQIKAGRSKFKINLFDEVQEVEISKKGKSLDIGDNLIENFKKVIHSVGINMPKYEVNGVLIEIKSGLLNTVGTDTTMLSLVTAKTSNDDMEIIVPKDAISSIIRLFGHLDVTAFVDETSLTISTEILDYSTKLISGKFPTWQRIVPQSFAQKFTINKDKFATLVKEASLFDTQITVKIKDQKILIKDFDGNTEVEDTVSDSNIDMNFHVNAKNILDFISSYSDDEITIGLVGEKAYGLSCIPINWTLPYFVISSDFLKSDLNEFEKWLTIIKNHINLCFHHSLIIWFDLSH